MMKKSEEFRRETLRPRPKAKKPKKAKPGGATKPAKAHQARGAGHTASRNRSEHAHRKASFALEDSATGRPSRKSSRASANRIKSDSALRRRASGRTTSPESRASRGK